MRQTAKDRPNRQGQANKTALVAAKFRFHNVVNLDRRLTDTDRRVSWSLLSEYLNSKTLLAFPSAQTLAEKLGVHESTVWRSIDRLCRYGYWKRVQGGGRGKSNRYQPNLETIASAREFSPETVATTQVNSRTHAPKTVASRREEPLEEPFENPLSDEIQNTDWEDKAWWLWEVGHYEERHGFGAIALAQEDIARCRKALGDDGARRRIEFVRQRGYYGPVLENFIKRQR